MPRPFRLALMALFTALLLMTATSAAVQAGRPNVVYLIADDQNYRDFGFMGSPDALTPHLDVLAARSLRFVNGYVPSSLCSPSLATLLTGLYPHQSGLHYNHPPPGNAAFNRMLTRAEYEAARRPSFEIIRNLPTLPRVLTAAGYETLQTGKFWEGHFRNAGFTQGMTRFEPREGQHYGGNRTLPSGELAAHGNGDHGLRIGRETMRPIAEFLDAVAESKRPFFIWYAPYLPHQPHDSPPEYFARYEGRDVAAHRLPYLASVSQFDDTVGELLKMLDARGLRDNTLVVLVSDNGWTPSLQRDRQRAAEFAPTRESKYSPFEDGLRTPILLYWPGKIRSVEVETPVSSVDLFPTVLEAVGLPDAVPNLPGRSLLRAGREGESFEPRPVFGEIYPGDATRLRDPDRDIAYRWVRDGDHKLIVPHPRGEPTAWRGYVEVESLYDVRQDPEEKTNLIETFPDIAESLRRKLDAWWLPREDDLVE